MSLYVSESTDGPIALLLNALLGSLPAAKKGGEDVSFPFIDFFLSLFSLLFFFPLHFEKKEKRRLRRIYAWRQPSEKERKKEIDNILL